MIDRPNGSFQGPAVVQPYAVDVAQAVDPVARELDPRRLWKIVVRRRKLLFAIWAGFFVAVALFTLVQPRKYTTATKLIAGSAGTATVDNGGDAASSGTGLPILNALMAASGQQSPETYAELIQQSPVAAEVIQQLHLNTTVGGLLSHLSVRPVTDTAIISIAVTWGDPETAARIANAFAAVFVDHERQLVAHQADSAIAFLEKELPAAESRMRATQEAMAAYQTRTGIADLPTQTASDLASISMMETKEQQAELDARVAGAQLETVEQQLASTPQTVVGSESVASNPVSGQLASQIATLKVQLAAAKRQYTDDFPQVIQLKSQLAEAERELQSQPAQVNAGTSTIPNPLFQQLSQQAATLQTQIASADEQVNTLKAQRAAAQPRLDRLPVESRRITDLQREEKSAEGVYDALQRKYQDALISRTTALSDVAITQAASPDVYNVAPNIAFNLALGFVVGLALAITAVFGAEFLDDRFRTEDDVRDRLGLPVLATIPLVDSLEWKENAWVKPLAVESFYQLVASLRYSSSNPPRTITFTSADQGDGKSTVAMNTAISMGQMKARVLIIDADLRRPTMHAKFNVSNESGLSDVLVGVTQLEDAIRPTEHSGVFLLSSGRPAPNPVGLLQSDGFDRLIKRARERFDFVVIDGPALRSIVDGVVLGIKAEGTVLVVSSASSEGRAVRGAIEKLRAVGGINFLGIVLNRTRPDRRETSDYYLGAGQSIPLPPESPV
jgi:capsular exopolysaccharide synthesis family protein